MLPDCIDATNFRYIKLDNKYVVSLSIKSLPDKIYFLDVINLIDKNVEWDMSIYCSKIDTTKMLNDITYNLTLLKSELSTINPNQKNIDVISRATQDAQNLRRKIQLENQEVYEISVILSFYSDNFNQIQKIISNFKSKFYSKMIKSDITNFRHLEFYLSNLPLNIKKEVQNKIYITTDALANMFSFYTQTILDENGIIIGYALNNNVPCFVDIFSNKYENSNICIFGSSGSGKSFFTKLFICRNFFQGKKQIILDIEGEYISLCKKLNGKIINENTYFNLLEITQKDISEKNFLENKIKRIAEYMYTLCDTKNLDIQTLKAEIITLYKSYGITDDISSVTCYQKEDTIFLDSKILSKEKFPTLTDLKNTTKDQKLKAFLIENLKGKLKFFSKTSTYNLNEDLYVICVDKLEHNKDILWFILDKILNRYLDKNETIIYIDEVWKYAMDNKLLESVLNMYKTIRKRHGSIVTITQDITDIFKYEDGFYSKSILNNSCFKVIFKTDYKDEKLFDKVINLDDEKIATLKKGEAYFVINKNKIPIKIKSNRFEGELINEDDNSYK